MECSMKEPCNKNSWCSMCAAKGSEKELYKYVRVEINSTEEILRTRMEGTHKLEQGATNWREMANGLATVLAADPTLRKLLSKVG